MSVEPVNRLSFSLPRDRIIRKPDAFRELYREGLRLRGENITIHYRKGTGLPFRVGFSTRKKLASAVGRNRVRRLMREVFRLRCHEIREDVQCLFTWHGPVRGKKYADAEREMMGLLERAGLLWK